MEPQPTPGFDSGKEEILSQLGIPSHLADCTDCGLVVAYQKYKAQLQASQTYERMLADGSWLETSYLLLILFSFLCLSLFGTPTTGDHFLGF